jgi:hypothetical protein
LEIKEASIENNYLRHQIMRLEQKNTRDIEATKTECEAAAKLVLDGKINDAKPIIEQWETALNAERENYRILQRGH